MRPYVKLVILSLLLGVAAAAWATDAFITIPDANKKLDVEQLTVSSQTVLRQRMQLGGATDVAIAAVANTAPIAQYGLVTRQAFASTTDPYTHRPGGRITTATTTTVLAGTASQKVYVYALHICLDAGGTAGNLTIQDSAGTNLVGTSATFNISAGTCLTLKHDHPTYAIDPTGTANGLQIVTAAVGPYTYKSYLRKE